MKVQDKELWLKVVRDLQHHYKLERNVSESINQSSKPCTDNYKSLAKDQQVFLETLINIEDNLVNSIPAGG